MILYEKFCVVFAIFLLCLFANQSFLKCCGFFEIKPIFNSRT